MLLSLPRGLTSCPQESCYWRHTPRDVRTRKPKLRIYQSIITSPRVTPTQISGMASPAAKLVDEPRSLGFRNDIITMQWMRYPGLRFPNHPPRACSYIDSRPQQCLPSSSCSSLLLCTSFWPHSSRPAQTLSPASSSSLAMSLPPRRMTLAIERPTGTSPSSCTILCFFLSYANPSPSTSFVLWHSGGVSRKNPA